MMDPKINFEGIDCPNLRREVQTLMEELFQVLPSDSTVRANFAYLPNRFLAEIRVASESAVMGVRDQATALSDLLESVRRTLMGQVVDWRNHRFAC